MEYLLRFVIEHSFLVEVVFFGIPALYWTVQIFRDYRRGDYLMASIGAILLMILVALSCVPIETHAVMLDMPPPSAE